MNLVFHSADMPGKEQQDADGYRDRNRSEQCRIQMESGVNAIHPFLDRLQNKRQHNQDRREDPGQPASDSHPQKDREDAVFRLAQRDRERQRDQADKQSRRPGGSCRFSKQCEAAENRV